MIRRIYRHRETGEERAIIFPGEYDNDFRVIVQRYPLSSTPDPASEHRDRADARLHAYRIVREWIDGGFVLKQSDTGDVPAPRSQPFIPLPEPARVLSEPARVWLESDPFVPPGWTGPPVVSMSGNAESVQIEFAGVLESFETGQSVNMGVDFPSLPNMTARGAISNIEIQLESGAIPRTIVEVQVRSRTPVETAVDDIASRIDLSGPVNWASVWDQLDGLRSPVDRRRALAELQTMATDARRDAELEADRQRRIQAEADRLERMRERDQQAREQIAADERVAVERELERREFGEKSRKIDLDE